MSILSFKTKNLTKILEWKNFIKLKVWLEEEMRLVTGRTIGAFDIDKMPHAERICDEIDKLRVRMVVMKMASQTIKTTIGVSSILKLMDTEPSDSMIMFPRESEISKMYDNKVKPALAGCANIQEKIARSEQDDRKKSRAFGLNIAGFILNILATNNTKSVSTKFNYFDEVVEYLAGKLEEAMERAKSFNGAGEKFIISSTQHPTKNGDDEINYYYDTCRVKLQYWMCCKECGEHYYPEPETLVYPNIEKWCRENGFEKGYKPDSDTIAGEYSEWVIERARLRCIHCDYEMTNRERREQILNKKCKWFEVEKEKNEKGSAVKWKRVEKETKDYRSVGVDVNTLCIEGYHMGDIAQKLVQAETSIMKVARLQMIHVGFFNRVYKLNIKRREAADILLLTNGLENWIVPKDTAKLYFIVDTQKDHYWWMLMAVKWGKIYNVVAHGRAEEDKQLKELMFRSYETEDGNRRYVDRATIDMRGYQRVEEKDEDGNIVQSRVNTTERVREFIIETNIEARENGFIGEDEHFLWGTMGKEKIGVTEKELKEAQSKDEAPVGKMYMVKTFEDKENKNMSYKVMYISNLAAKTELFLAINDNIDNFKNKEKGEEQKTKENIYFINEDMRQEGVERVGRNRQEDFEMMMTSEIYDFDVRNGNMMGYKTFFQIRKRNDQLDNSSTGVTLTALDNIGVGVKESGIGISGMDMFNGVFNKN